MLLDGGVLGADIPQSAVGDDDPFTITSLSHAPFRRLKSSRDISCILLPTKERAYR